MKEEIASKCDLDDQVANPGEKTILGLKFRDDDTLAPISEAEIDTPSCRKHQREEKIKTQQCSDSSFLDQKLKLSPSDYQTLVHAIQELKNNLDTERGVSTLGATADQVAQAEALQARMDVIAQAEAAQYSPARMMALASQQFRTRSQQTASSSVKNLHSQRKKLAQKKKALEKLNKAKL